ncbi:MAG: hypothetical protein EOO88_62840, partial [Pedobacter sp.]
NVFIAFADTLFKADFKIDTAKDAIIWTQKVEDPSAFGVVKLAADGRITEFVEKPEQFVSDLAIIGVYYFKDGENLKAELQYLLDNKIAEKGEFQLTTAMENMKNKGMAFYSDQVEEWLDCGNKDATVYTNQRILEIKKDREALVASSAVLENATIIAPCFIGEGVVVRNSVVGPHVSLEQGVTVENASISPCITSYSINWGEGSTIENVTFPQQHTYTQLGVYTITIYGYGQNGCNSVKTYQVKNISNPSGGLYSPGSTTNLCAPTAPIQFAITGWYANSLDTTYEVDFGDGTTILNLTQSDLINSSYYNSTIPANSQNYPIPHVYNISNCPGGPFE